MAFAFDDINDPKIEKKLFNITGPAIFLVHIFKSLCRPYLPQVTKVFIKKIPIHYPISDKKFQGQP